MQNRTPITIRFGLAHGQYENLHLNRFLFSGKELQDIPGANNSMLGWYDFGFRHYNPLLGHWMTPDPLARNFAEISPYAYCMNNPVNLIDFWGLFPGGRYLDNGTIGIDPVVVYGRIPKRGYNLNPSKTRRYTKYFYYSYYGELTGGGGSQSKVQNKTHLKKFGLLIQKQVEKYNNIIKKINTPGEILNAINDLDPTTKKALLKYFNITNRVSKVTYGIDIGIIANKYFNETITFNDKMEMANSTIGLIGPYGFATSLILSGAMEAANYVNDLNPKLEFYFENKIKGSFTR